MMYRNNLAVAIKVDGKILRENKDEVRLPFGSEFSILIKNLETVRAQAKIFIDGIDVTDGGVVVPANGELNLERFIKSGNLKKGNKFKFIERTGAVEEHRGIDICDGLVRVEYQFEKKKPIVQETVYRTRYEYDPYWAWPHNGYPYPKTYLGGYGSSQLLCGSNDVMLNSITTSCSVGAPVAKGVSLNNAAVRSATPTFNLFEAEAQNLSNDVGITVAGSESDQEFVYSSWFAVEDVKHVITLKLLGKVSTGQKVSKPITVKTKIGCTTCGHKSKSSVKFCPKCGTSLNII